MITSLLFNPNSSLSQSDSPAKFTKTDPKITATFQRKSKLQSLISTQNPKEEPIIEPETSNYEDSLHSYKVFYEGPNQEKAEMNVHLGDTATVQDFINSAIKQLKILNKAIYETFIFSVYFAKKSGKPKSDLPALDYKQFLKDCGDSCLLYLKAIDSKNEMANRATRCSSSFNNEVYRKNSLLENANNKFDKDCGILKEKSFLGRLFCC